MTIDDQVLMLGLAALLLLVTLLAVSMAREEWDGRFPWNPPAKRRKYWRVFWLIVGAALLTTETLAFFGLGWIPLVIMGGGFGVIVIGGFIGLLITPRV